MFIKYFIWLNIMHPKAFVNNEMFFMNPIEHFTFYLVIFLANVKINNKKMSNLLNIANRIDF